MRKKNDLYEAPVFKHHARWMITPIGIALFCLMMALIVHFYPWNPEKGLVSINHSSIWAVVDAEIIEDPDEKIIDAACIPDLFTSGTLAGGCLAQKDSDTFHFLYKDSLRKNKYHLYDLEDRKYTFLDKVTNLSNPGIFFGEYFVSVESDHKVIYQNTTNLSRGELKFDWKEAIQTKDGYDYSKAAAILSKGEGKLLSLREAAVIVGLVQEHVLIGYQDGTAWFAEDAESGFMKLLKADADSCEIVLEKIEKPEIYAMVADGRYLIEDYKDQLIVYNFVSGKAYSYPIKGEDGEEPVLGFSYTCRDGKVTVYQFGENSLQWFVLDNETDKAVNLQTHKYRTETDEPAQGISVLMREEVDTVWLRLKNDYHWYTVGEVIE